MRRTGGTLACRNCRRDYPADGLDRARWCRSCRGEVVRRATVAGRVAGGVAALAVLSWIVFLVGPSPRFLIGWIVLVGAVFFVVYKLVQRMAFEIIRSRGVPPPEATDA